MVEVSRPLAPPHLAGVCPNQASFPSPWLHRAGISSVHPVPVCTHHSSCRGVEFFYKNRKTLSSLPPSPPPPLLYLSYLLNHSSSLSLTGTCPSSLVWALDCMSLCPPHTFQATKHHQRPPASYFGLLSGGPTCVPSSLEHRSPRTPLDLYSRLEL